tara:strand:- start:461 stop:1321 length:861 start_codon:yes stop_codon:yes gene_type:complete
VCTNYKNQLDFFDLASIWHPVISEPDEVKPFSLWYGALQKKSGFESVRDGFSKVWAKHPDNGQRAMLVLQVFTSCWEAYRFDQDGDPMVAARKLAKDADATRKDIAKLAKDLTTKLKAIHPAHPLALNLGHAASLAKERGAVLSAAPNLPDSTNSSRWVTLLESLKESMSYGTPGYKAGPFYHRTHVGCLDYKVPIESRSNLVEAPTILLFDLVFFFRDFTETGSAFRRSGTMSENGKPCYRVAADIVNLVFDKNWTNSAARDLVRQLLETSPPNRGAWARTQKEG